MRPAKFNFEPIRKVNAKQKIARKRKFLVSCKYKYIYFPISYVEENNLEGKMIKWFVDHEKKALGWRVLSECKLELLDDLKEYIIVKRTKNQFKFSIGRVLRALNFTNPDASFKNLEAHDYREIREGFDNGIIHYLILNKSQQEK